MGSPETSGEAKRTQSPCSGASGQEGEQEERLEGGRAGWKQRAHLCLPGQLVQVQGAGDRSFMPCVAGWAGQACSLEAMGEPLNLLVHCRFLSDKTASEDRGEEADRHYAGFYEWQLILNEC